MRRRFALLVAPLAALSLIGAGCGGGDSQDSGSGSSGSPSTTDPAQVLAGIKAPSADAPANIAMDMQLAFQGQLSNPQVAAILNDGKVSVKLNGPSDPKTKSVDLKFDLKAGKIALAGGIRSIEGKQAFINLQDKWYELDAGSLQDTAQQATDPQKLLDAIGDPVKLFKDPKVVGSETIDGVETDHVSGQVDPAGLVNAVANVAANQGEEAPDQAERDKAVAELQKILRSGTVDLWVGKEDKLLHRIKVAADIAVPEDQKAQLGAEGMDVTMTIQSTPTSAPKITAPAGALPSSQLQADLGTILLTSLGSGG